MSGRRNQPLLLIYRESCSKCRALSRIVAVLSLGAVARVARSSPAAAALLPGAPTRARLLLFDGRERLDGRRALAAVLRRWLRR